MCCADARNARRDRGFTLLEIMLAVLIMALVGVSMFRFMDANLQAIRISTQVGQRREALGGLTAVVRGELNALPPLEQGAILGQAHTFQGMAADELTWKCQAGNGLLTANATGTYDVTLTVRRDSAGRTSSLSLGRVRAMDAGIVGQLGTVSRNVPFGLSEVNWRDLITNVDGVEFRYFDARENSWVDHWNDQNARPALVRMRIWRDGNPVPFEAILPVPRTQPPTTG